MSKTRKAAIYSAAFTLCLGLSAQTVASATDQIITYPDGSQYTGKVINGKPSGQGRIQWANGDTYEGQWRNEQPHGEGTKTFLDGSVYTGEFVRGQQQGHGELVYPDGTIYVGEWQNDAPNGQGKFMFRDAGTYEGAVYLGLPHGQGTFTYANGDVYDGQWEHGKRSGRGTLHYRNGDKYTGQFEKGQPEGTGTITFADGVRYKGNFTQGKPDGDGTCYKQNEQALCSYVEGEQIAYAVIPDYSNEPATMDMAGQAPLNPDVTSLAAAASAADELKATAKNAFVAALTDEKQKLKPSYKADDLNPERSDILFHHNFEALNLGEALRTGWWENQRSLFSNHLMLHTRSGDLELELKIKRFDGPGTYRIKPDQIRAWFKGKVLQGLRDFANTITIRKVEDAWVEGSINLSFQQKDTYGEHYKVENGVFRLNNEPIFNPIR